MQSSQFAVAIHLIVLMRYTRDKLGGAPLTSQEMAESAQTNPVVVRRVLGELRNAGIVVSQPGPTGGWQLAHRPGEIRLSEVYRALHPKPVLVMPPRAGSPDCVVGGVIQHTLCEIFSEAEAAMEQRLSEVTVRDVLDRMFAQARTDLPKSPLARTPRSVTV